MLSVATALDPHGISAPRTRLEWGHQSRVLFIARYFRWAGPDPWAALETGERQTVVGVFRAVAPGEPPQKPALTHGWDGVTFRRSCGPLATRRGRASVRARADAQGLPRRRPLRTARVARRPPA